MNKITTKEDKLALGIEIVAAMKASAYNATIEDGRLMALDETEPEHFECYKNGTTPECQIWGKIAKQEKERLHEQALFVAEITLSKIIELTNKDKP